MAIKYRKGRKVRWQTTIKTATLDEVNYLIFRVKDLSHGTFSMRWFPHTDPQSFIKSGVQYRTHLVEAEADAILDRFDSVVGIVRDPSNPAHIVKNWTNWDADASTPVVQGEDGRWSITPEVTIPATGWTFRFPSKSTIEEDGAVDALNHTKRAH